MARMLLSTPLTASQHAAMSFGNSILFQPQIDLLKLAFIVIMWSVRNPKVTDVSFSKLRAASVAPTTRIKAIAISAAAKKLRARLVRLLESAPGAPDILSLIPAPIRRAEIWTAGARPKRVP